MNRAGADILLLPGLLNDQTLWRYHAAVLAGVNITIPVFGDYDNIPAIVDELLKQAPAQFVLVGFSMGGYVALEILRHRPERVLGLALLSTSARADSNEQRLLHQQTINAVAAGKFDRIVETISAVALYPKVPDIDQARRHLRAMAAAIGPARFCLHLRAVINRTDHREMLAQIAVPTVVAVGAHDRVVAPAFSGELAAAIPEAELRVIDGAGHILPLQAGMALTTVLTELLDRL